MKRKEKQTNYIYNAMNGIKYFNNTNDAYIILFTSKITFYNKKN